MKRPARKLDLPLLLNSAGENPLYLQLRDQIIEAIRSRRLSSGMKLPSTRELAKTLGVSRIVTIAAYEELDAQGYILSRQGSGTVIADLPGITFVPPRRHKSHQEHTRPEISFEPGYSDAAAIKPQTWKKIWRYMAAEPLANRGIGPRDSGLREVLSDYIVRTRGFVAKAEDFVITSGAAQALDLIALACRPENRIGLEDPGYKRAQTIFSDRSFTPVPLPVGQHGLLVESLTSKKLPLVYVTPSHQYPLGGTMPVASRLKLLEWAKKNDAYIIEDDFDSEFRYDIAPVPALKSLDTYDRVIYIGTFSKVISPELRLGYIVPPAKLLPHLLMLKRQGYDSTPWPVQRALYHMIRLGELDKHVRRMRLLYARRRQVLQTMLVDLPKGFEIVGEQAGLHCVLLFPPGASVSKTIKYCEKNDVQVVDLATYYRGPHTRRGLVIGYGHLDETQIRKGCAVLKEGCIQSANK